MKSIKNLRHIRLKRLPKMILPVIFIILFVLCSNCCACVEYVWPHQMQWYNTSINGTTYAVLGLDVETVASKSITILDSDSDQIGLSLYYCSSPKIYRTVNNDSSEILFRIWTWDNYPTVKPELYIYLPRGLNCTIVANQVFGSENQVINRYSEGNLTLYVNDPATYLRYLDYNIPHNESEVIS
jgi:hypothetical protein